MVKDETYYFHQTPNDVCMKLIETLPIKEGDVLLEPFKGEGSFFNNFPNNTINHFCEIEEGVCYKTYKDKCDWVISNPPFRLEDETKGKRVNTFFKLVLHFAPLVNKGIAFLGNDRCFSTLTPIRLKKLETEHGLFLNGYVVCSIKKWRGRYFFITFTKNKSDNIKYIEGNF